MDGVGSEADAIWKSELNELEYYVLRKEGPSGHTRRATDNKAMDLHCNASDGVFSSKHKYDSETGCLILSAS